MHRARHAGAVDLLDLHQRAPSRYPFLLQSAAGHPDCGRYDILFAFPSGHLKVQNGHLSAQGVADAAGNDFFARLSAWSAQEHEPEVDSDLPFHGGWFVFLGYEMAGHVESRLRLPASPFTFPDALAVRCPAAIIHDRQKHATWLLAERDAGQLRQMEADLRATLPPASGSFRVLQIEEEPPEHFLTGVERVLDYLRAGDVFQVNLSRAWQARLSVGASTSAIYRQLRISNPAPFAGLAVWDDSAVISSSPERLVEVRGREVQTRPIAGTRPRGAEPAADLELRTQLIASLKERAEHIMLIDLERNDLGRVCEPGSVAVSELMTVESYAHVHHIVSNVRGRLRPDIGPGDVLRAVFPGGTITGCPKIRAMEIIAQIEGIGRGPYTGAMGYLGVDGRLDMNILIRSLVREGESLHFRAGAGIVSDSVPELELAETRSKARGLLKALEAKA